MPRIVRRRSGRRPRRCLRSGDGRVPADHHRPARAAADVGRRRRRRSRPTGPTPTSPATRAGRRRTRSSRRERLIAEQATLDGPVAGDWIQIAVDARRRARRRRRRRARRRRAHRHDRLHAGARRTRVAGWPREAVGAVVDRLFDELGVHRVEAVARSRATSPRRGSSRASASSYEGTAVSAVLVGDEWVDDVRYALTADARAAWATAAAAPPGRRPPRRDHAGQRRRAVLRLRTHRSQQRFVAADARLVRRRAGPRRSSTAPRSCRGAAASRPTASWPGS